MKPMYRTPTTARNTTPWTALIACLLVIPAASASPDPRAALAPAAVTSAQAAAPAVPAQFTGFDATALTGGRVGPDALLGQPTVLVVTPSRDAAESTREWAQALRGRVPQQQARVRDLIAIDLPFFMSREDALERAREKIPARYHDMTWLSTDTTIERAFGIARDANEATVLVLGPRGDLRARASGTPTQDKVDEILSAVQALVESNPGQ